MASSLLSSGLCAPEAPSASTERPDQSAPDVPPDDSPDVPPAVPPPQAGRPGEAPAGDAALPEIPGTGVLRQGDTGHGVYELQTRLLQLPDVSYGGAVDGRFGTHVRQAVAQFQARYGIQGDEAGVYGHRTRHALMLRTI